MQTDRKSCRRNPALLKLLKHHNKNKDASSQNYYMFFQKVYTIHGLEWS